MLPVPTTPTCTRAFSPTDTRTVSPTGFVSVFRPNIREKNPPEAGASSEGTAHRSGRRFSPFKG